MFRREDKTTLFWYIVDPLCFYPEEGREEHFRKVFCEPDKFIISFPNWRGHELFYLLPITLIERKQNREGLL